MEAPGRLINRLRAAGELDSVGEFTLDRARARDKMRQFQLTDPRSYVLELVQAAVLAGATEARFEIDADDMRLAFDGRPFTVEDFDQLYSAMFARRPASGARRQLALGLNAVMALDPEHVHVASGEVRVEMHIGADDEITKAERPVDGTRIHVRYRFSNQTVLRFFRKLRGNLAEVVYLEELCPYVRLPIYVNGETISGQAPLADALARVETDVSGFSIVAGFIAERPAARLAILKEGVWIASHKLEGLPHPFVCCVDGAELQRDASQRDIVRNEAYDRLLAALPEVLHLALASLAELVPEHPAREALFRHVLFHPSTLPLAKEQLAAVRAGSDPPREKLAAVPLWVSARNPRIVLSLLDLFRLGTSQKRVGWARSQYPRIVLSLLDFFHPRTSQKRVGWAHSRYPEVVRQDEPPIAVISLERERSYLTELFGDGLYRADPLLHNEQTRIRIIERRRQRRIAAKSPAPRLKHLPTFENHETPWVPARLRGQELAAAQPLDRFELSPYEVLIKVALTAEGLRGEVGLRREPEVPGLELDLHRGGRFYVTLNTAAPCALVAIIDDDALTLDEHGLPDPDGERPAELADLCLAQVPRLIAELGAGEEPWRPPSRDAAFHHLVHYLAAEAAREGERGNLDQRLWEAATELPVFRGVDQPYSYADLCRSYANFGRQAVLPWPADGTPADPRRCVLVAQPAERALLKLLFPELEDIGRQETHEGRLLQALHAELCRAGKRHAHLLDDKNLDRIALGNLHSDIIASCRSQGVTVNRRQPLVRQLLEETAIDPVQMAFLASAVYTSMNYFWHEIEDDHEREFQGELIAGLLRRPPGSGNARA